MDRTEEQRFNAVDIDSKIITFFTFLFHLKIEVFVIIFKTEKKSYKLQKDFSNKYFSSHHVNATYTRYAMVFKINMILSTVFLHTKVPLRQQLPQLEACTTCTCMRHGSVLYLSHGFICIHLNLNLKKEQKKMLV